jgi:Erv1 / Alr family
MLALQPSAFDNQPSITFLPILRFSTALSRLKNRLLELELNSNSYPIKFCLMFLLLTQTVPHIPLSTMTRSKLFSHAFDVSSKLIPISGFFIAAHLKSWTSHCDGDGSIDSNSIVGMSADSERPKLESKKVNPFDCHNPACSSKMDLLKNAMKKRKNIATLQVAPESLLPALSSSSVIAIVSPDPSVTADNDIVKSSSDRIDSVAIIERERDSALSKAVSDCPLDKEELGRSTWNLIHTVAAYYPDSPSEEDKGNARNFILALSHLYPCEVCRSDFKESVANFPPL